ncbi:hypothetical protein H4F99_09875 [Lysobacter sp. SG-8]|uniref:Uncharacterized protein n=1 Tax=Marilutibacter penaei TaxID=2759900 RepID=A0A7W3U4N1_9GAMM|nr:hypothetical protein [Lysobacter penaei]MBB1088798.1 hypothetical protein [Lysobacter penaei]
MKINEKIMYAIAASIVGVLVLGLYIGTRMAERDNSIQEREGALRQERMKP